MSASFAQQIDLLQRQWQALQARGERPTDEDALRQFTATLDAVQAAGAELENQAAESAWGGQFANDLFQALVDTLPVGVMVCKADGTVQMTNATGEAILGSQVAGSIYRPERSYTIHRLDGTPFPLEELPLRLALERGASTGNVEILVRRPDGTEHVILSAAAPVRDAAGQVASAVVIFQDITAHKQAEEALREAKDELESKVQERTAELQQANERLAQENQERIRTEQSLRLEEARLDALLHLSQISDASLPEIASFTLEQAIALTNSKIGFVGFLNEDESVYTLHAVSKDVVKECNVTGDPIQWHVVDAGIWADAIRKRRTLFINDYSEPHPRKKGLPLGHPYVERFMVVPILEGERIVAIAGVGNKASDYDRSDERQIVLLVSGMWGYVQRNRAREELEQAYDELEERVQQRTAELSVSNAALREEIAQRQRAEQERERLLVENRRQRAFLERLIEAAPVGLAVVRAPDHRYEMVNPCYQAIPGMPDASMVGRTIAQVFPDVAAQGALEMVEQVYQTGQTVSVREYGAAVGPGRTQTYWDVDHVPLWGPDGIVDGVLIVANEVTDDVLARRQVQELAATLARERDALQTIMENTQAQLAYLDPQFRFVRVNSTYAQGSGHSAGELLGRHHFDLFPNSENQAIFERVRDTGDPVEFHARPFEFADQPERGVTYWDWTLVPVKDPAGQVQGLVLSLMDVTDTQRLLMALDAERARLTAIIENAPEAIVVVDEACRIVLTNPAANRLYARPVPHGQELTSHAGLALCYGDGTPYDPRDLPLTRSARGGETFSNLEMAVRWPDEQLRDLLVSTAPIHDDQGQIHGAVGVFQDITERKRTRALLQQYADRLQVLHETDRAILAARSAEEIVAVILPYIHQGVPCQRASVVAFDWELGEALVLGVLTDGETRLGAGQRFPITDLWFIDVLRQGQVYTVEDIPAALSSPLAQALRAEGTRAVVSVPLVVHDDLIGALNLGLDTPDLLLPEQMAIIWELADELAVGIHQAHLRDRVQRHTAELEDLVTERTAELRVSEAHFRAIFEDAALGIALADVEGRLMTSNPAFQRILGYTAEELDHVQFTELAHPDDVNTDMDLYQELMVGSQDHYRMEKRYIRKGGQVVWANLTVSLIRDTTGEPRYTIGMVEDITERREAQEALIRAEKLALTGRLAAALAHEINNPLQSVIGCLGLTQEALDAGRDVRRYVQVAVEELERAARIVTQLRDLQRWSELEERVPTDVNALVERVLTLNQKHCANRGVEMVWEPATDLPPLHLTPDRIQQVFLNLVLNAVEAISEGGELRVSTGHDLALDQVCVTFADTGVGIDSDALPHLFEPFHSTKPDGLGLGLYVSHDIVTRHGGCLDVESTPGVGTTFTVRLPA